MSIITLKQLKISLQAVKSYIDRIIPKNISELENDTGYLTGDYLPDWNAKENEDGYIANRTHWKEENAEQLLIDNNDPRLEIRYEFNGGAEIECNIVLDRSGKTYTVIIDDVEFTCSYNTMFSYEDCISFTGYNQDMNVRLYQYQSNPEIIYVEPSNSGKGFLNQTMSITILDNGNTIYTGNINTNTITYKYITNNFKLYKEGINNYIIKFGPDEYQIEINADEESGFYYEKEEQIDEYIWNPLYQLYNGPSYEFDGQYEFSLRIYPQVNHNGEFSISKPASIIYHKLDGAYIPHSDWEAEENENGYIENKTHWKEYEFKRKYDISAITGQDPRIDYSNIKIPTDYLLQTGDILTVTINGTSQTLSACTEEEDSDGNLFVGVGQVDISTGENISIVQYYYDTNYIIFSYSADNIPQNIVLSIETSNNNIICTRVILNPKLIYELATSSNLYQVFNEPTKINVELNGTNYNVNYTPKSDNGIFIYPMIAGDKYLYDLPFYIREERTPYSSFPLYIAFQEQPTSLNINIQSINYHKLDNNYLDVSPVAISGDYDDLINKPTIPVVPVTDVQVNEMSILSDGVANIPIASGTDFGVAKVNPTYGIGLYDGFLILNNATSQDIKSGNNSTKAISTYRQHESTFYGLSKAAGVSMASSDNPVGTYTDEAKTAIRNMIGAVGPTDYANQTTGGVVKIIDNGSGGVKIDQGYLMLQPASINSIKSSNSSTLGAIVPGSQHSSTFYGLAKAAGDTTQSQSDNTVGTYTDAAKSAIKNMLGVIDPAVSDVQINGTSILSNGVANIPRASLSTVGAVKVNGTFGTAMRDAPNDDTIMIAKANITNIKEGMNRYQPIVPYNQHEAVFYGLTKVAGVDMASSDNAVGTYTDTAKTAIKTMLGVTDPTVSDVQINGTSVLNNGVANILTASENNSGVVKVSPTYGLDIGTTNQHIGFIRIYPPLDGYIKRGEGYYNPVTVSKQHQAVFYGLAKAAGDITQSSSSNAVGTYTDTAKTAIKTMLGVPNDSYDLSEGELLPAYADLLDYTTPGVYYADDSTANTISSSPTNFRFKLIVEKIDDRNVRQTVIDYGGRNYITVIDTVTHDVIMWSRFTTNDDLQYLVKDVQVNGTSVVDEYGYAYIPVANTTDFGVVKVNPSRGITVTSNDGIIYVNGANANTIKTGTQAYQPIVPMHQHVSTFYGLTKAAGVDMSSSNNAVGTYTDEAKSAIKTMLGVVDPTVSDVQINNTSILSNGIASIPLAGNNVYGVVKTGGNGIAVNSSGILTISRAESSQIKNATSGTAPITPYVQHESVFYGLAKAAGDATQSTSNNTVGTYTTEAKTAIKSMLGVPNATYDLGKGSELPVNADLDTYTIPGVYHADSSVVSTILNKATTNEFKLIVERTNDNYVRQTYIDIYGPWFTRAIDSYYGYAQDWGKIITDQNYATSTTPGVVIVDPDYGLYMANSDSRKIAVNFATSGSIKNGTNTSTVISAGRQHESAFYGLAKAAGDTTQSSSSNAVGTYTDNAKSAIRAMIGAEQQIYIGSGTPAGYKIWIDPEEYITDAEEVDY